MQSNKNNRDSIYIQKEHVHNFMSLVFTIVGMILLMFVLLYASIKDDIILITYSSIFVVFMIIRIVINLKLMFSFEKLVKKINPEQIEFYITKSWTRKREGAIWVGVMYLITLTLMLAIVGILTNFFEDIPVIITCVFMSIHMFLIIIYMFVNIQSLDSRLKISEKRLTLDSTEWTQIRKDQSAYYKLLLIWYFHAIIVIPLILMVIPAYRGFWNNLLKN